MVLTKYSLQLFNLQLKIWSDITHLAPMCLDSLMQGLLWPLVLSFSSAPSHRGKNIKGQKTRGQKQLNDRKLIDACMSWIQTGSVHKNTNRIFQKQLQDATVLQWIRCFCLFNSVCINLTKTHSNVLMSCVSTLNDSDKDKFVLS